MSNEFKPVDFTIISKPDHINLECPFCGNDINVPWNDVDSPECWQDDWGHVECPICEEDIKLGDYEYD